MDARLEWSFVHSPRVEVTRSQLMSLGLEDNFVDSFKSWLQWTVNKTNEPSRGLLEGLTGALLPSMDEYVVRQVDADVMEEAGWVHTYILPGTLNLLKGDMYAFVIGFAIDQAMTETSNPLFKNPIHGSKDTVQGNMYEIIQMAKKCLVDKEPIDKERLQQINQNIVPHLKELHMSDIPCKLPNATHWSAVYCLMGRRIILVEVMLDVLQMFWGHDLTDRESVRENLRSGKFGTSTMKEALTKLANGLRDKNVKIQEQNQFDSSDMAYFFFKAVYKEQWRCLQDFDEAARLIDTIIKSTEEFYHLDFANRERILDDAERLLEELLLHALQIKEGRPHLHVNLLALFEGTAREEEFSKIVKDDIEPLLTRLQISQDLIQDGWKDFVGSLQWIRQELDKIRPSVPQQSHKIGRTADWIVEELGNLQRQENSEKVSSYNRLQSMMSALSDVVSVFELGSSIKDRAMAAYLNTSAELRDAVSRNEVNRVFSRAIWQTVNKASSRVSKSVERVIDTRHVNAEPSVQLSGLAAEWTNCQESIIQYLKSLSTDRQTSQIFVKNALFDVTKMVGLLPKPLDKADAHETISMYLLCIFTVDQFFNRLRIRADQIRTDLDSQAGRVEPITKRVLATSKHHSDVQRIIDDLHRRERRIQGVSSNEQDHQRIVLRSDLQGKELEQTSSSIVSNVMLALVSRAFCVTRREDERNYFIDFVLYDPSATDLDSAEILPRLPDATKFVAYMRQHAKEINRVRKDAAFKVDFLKMLYTQFLTFHHSVEVGQERIQLEVERYRLPHAVSQAALSILAGDTNRTNALESIRSTQIFGQLLRSYDYERLVAEWSMTALQESDFEMLMATGKALFETIQAWYDSIFNIDPHTRQFSLRTRSQFEVIFSTSNLISILESTLPRSIYSTGMLLGIVEELLFTPPIWEVKRTIIGDAKATARRIMRAGATAHTTKMMRLQNSYLTYAIHRIRDWADRSGTKIPPLYLDHLNIVYVKILYSHARIFRIAFNTNLDDADIEQAVVTDISDKIAPHITVPLVLEEYVGEINKILTADYELLQKEFDDYRRPLKDSDIKLSKLYRYTLATRQALAPHPP